MYPTPITSHHEPFSTIIGHHQKSSATCRRQLWRALINHYEKSWTIIHHPEPSLTMTNIYQPRLEILNQYQGSKTPLSTIIRDTSRHHLFCTKWLQVAHVTTATTISLSAEAGHNIVSGTPPVCKLVNISHLRIDISTIHGTYPCYNSSELTAGYHLRSWFIIPPGW